MVDVSKSPPHLAARRKSDVCRNVDRYGSSFGDRCVNEQAR